MKRKLLFFILVNITVITSQIQRPVGVNLAFVKDWSTQWVFVDAMKQCRPWIVQDVAGQNWGVENIDIPSRPDGYPTHVPFTVNNQQYRVHTLLLREIPGLYPSGIYTIKFEGTGEIRLDFDTETVEYDQAGTYAFDVTPSGEGIHLTITESDVNDPIRNIKVIMPGFETTYETQPFHPRFLELLENFQVVRFMPATSTSETELSLWEDRATDEYYTQTDDALGSLSFEHIADICNAANKDAWINIPHLADDNFIQSLAELLKQRLNPGLKVYVEYSNETWNTAWPFYKAYSYCSEQGKELGLSDNDYEAALLYTVYRSIEIFEVFESIFDKNRLVKVLASHAANPWTGSTMLESLSNQTINPNDVTVDVFAIAPYFGGEIPDRIVDLGMLDNITIDAFVDSVEANMREEALSYIDQYANITQQYNVEMIAYEGGQHLTTLSYRDNQKLIDLIHEANRHERMQDLYCEYFDHWYNSGGGIFASFVLAESYSQWGAFGIIEHFNQNLETVPKWQAHVNCVFEYNSEITATEAATEIPSEYILEQNYPNPFNPETTIKFAVPEQTFVSIGVYNILGKKIETILKKQLSAGSYEVNFNADNQSSGIYFYKLETAKKVITKKMILVK